MPFDPSQPAAHSPLDSQVVRDQLNALKALIDAQAAQILALQLAIADTPHNANQSTLEIVPLDDPPTRPQFQQFMAAYNALLNQITRV